MSETYIYFVTDILIAVGIGAAGYLIAFLVSRFLRKILPRFMSDAWASFLANLASLSVILLTIKILVDQTGWAGAFVVVVTAITGAFAIGSERLAADLVAGIKLLFLSYYDVNDLVTIGGYVGTVDKITLTHTIVHTRQRDVVIIPNSTAINQIVVNHSKIPGHIVLATIPIPGKHQRKEAMAVMKEAAGKFDLLMDGFEPICILGEFAPNTTNYTVGVMVDENDWKPITSARLSYLIVEALEAAGFEVGISQWGQLPG